MKVIITPPKEHTRESGIADPDDSDDSTIVSSPSDLKESLRELNKDEQETGIKMRSIDLRSNLNDLEINGLVVMDFLHAVDFLPDSIVPFSQSFKRVKVSQDAMGRRGMIELVTGERKSQENKGFFGRLKEGMGYAFSGNKQDGNGQ
jgi:hypothetical protein